MPDLTGLSLCASEKDLTQLILKVGEKGRCVLLFHFITSKQKKAKHNFFYNAYSLDPLAMIASVNHVASSTRRSTK